MVEQSGTHIETIQERLKRRVDQVYAAQLPGATRVTKHERAALGTLDPELVWFLRHMFLALYLVPATEANLHQYLTDQDAYHLDVALYGRKLELAAQSGQESNVPTKESWEAAARWRRGCEF